jgi:hypothetical protein
MQSIPSGYIQLPLWFVVALFSCLTLIIGYVWHRMDKRVDAHGGSLKKMKEEIDGHDRSIKFNTGRLDKSEREGEESMKSEIAKGGFLTLKEHTEMCSNVCSNIAKMLNERFNSFESNLNLKLENIELKLLGKMGGVERRAIKRSKKRS